MLCESRQRFHNVATATGNALSPHLLSFVLEMFNFKDAFGKREYLPYAYIERQESLFIDNERQVRLKVHNCNYYVKSKRGKSENTMFALKSIERFRDLVCL